MHPQQLCRQCNIASNTVPSHVPDDLLSEGTTLLVEVLPQLSSMANPRYCYRYQQENEASPHLSLYLSMDL